MSEGACHIKRSRDGGTTRAGAIFYVDCIAVFSSCPCLAQRAAAASCIFLKEAKFRRPVIPVVLSHL